jgi:methylated-DNA-[protein]-cysteine S-methyltransferase
METKYTQIYHSPIGVIKIIASDYCIEELVFVEAEAVSKINLSEHSPPVIQQCIDELPFGKNLSYGELAKKMGDPNAVRAAAAANGKNKIAIIVPCHRIVGADRSLVGYAWGKARKKWLLQHEFRLALGVQTLF